MDHTERVELLIFSWKIFSPLYFWKVLQKMRRGRKWSHTEFYCRLLGHLETCDQPNRRFLENLTKCVKFRRETLSRNGKTANLIRMHATRAIGEG